jgi:signal transduction histidine kinase
MEINLGKKSKFGFIWAYSLIGALILISSLFVININIGIENFSNTVSLPVYTIIPGTLVILSIWAITRAHLIQLIPKKSLVFLALSFFSWFIAEQTWNLYEHVLGVDPYPSAADFFYLAAPIFMFISLIIFLKSTKKKISKKIILFSMVISAVLLIPSLVATFEVSSEDELFEVIIALSYPVVDSIVFVPAIITALFLISNRSFFWIMILLGLIIMVAADTIFLFLIIDEAYVDGHPVDILWVSSYTIWTFMMFYLITESRKYKEPKELLPPFNKYGTKTIEKFGVAIGLIVINAIVAILLVGINFFVYPTSDDTILDFFSWVLAMMVLIFSSIVVLLNSKLNKTLQNRTQQLEKTTEELIKSERFSAIGELASRISHDIRNPLSNIRMSIELIQKSPPETKITDDIIKNKLDLVTRNIERISHQVNDVLGFVQNREMKKEEFRISSCIHETIESIHIPKNISIQYPKSDQLVTADFFQLQIVFNNLIVNGIQAIGPNNGRIIIRISADKDNTIIEIENSGPRIPENILPHIFESLVTTKQVGTGLGLVSCKTIIENHKGRLTARNDPTTFTITLPNLTDSEKVEKP